MQTIETIFSAESMGPIFQLEKPGSLRLKSRENSGLEFKENFNWANRADYARTMAAFANNNGGYLVFGVADSPRRLKGIDSGKFLATVPAKITEFLNEYFSPEIHWEIGTYEFENLSFGILYVAQCNRKPVVCKKSNSSIVEGAIYYRYRGQTMAIKYPELRNLLDEQRQRDQEMILKHFRKVSEIGIINTSLAGQPPSSQEARDVAPEKAEGDQREVTSSQSPENSNVTPKSILISWRKQYPQGPGFLSGKKATSALSELFFNLQKYGFHGEDIPNNQIITLAFGPNPKSKVKTWIEDIEAQIDLQRSSVFEKTIEIVVAPEVDDLSQLINPEAVAKYKQYKADGRTPADFNGMSLIDYANMRAYAESFRAITK